MGLADGGLRIVGVSAGSLPASAVTDSRGTTIGDLLQFSGSSFVRIPSGAAGTLMVVRSDGTLGYIRTPRVYAQAWGTKNDGTTDDTTALTAAIAQAASLAGGAGLVDLGPGKLNISSLVTFTGSVSSEGAGGGLGANVGTRIICTAAAAGIAWNANGGTHKGYCIDGNNVATSGAANCVAAVSGAGAETNFADITVTKGAQDGWIITNGCQNHHFVGCSSQNHARDNLILDLGTGGHLFSRFESNAAGRYALVIQESGTSPGAYTSPTHIEFDHSIFERGNVAGTATALNLTAGASVKFDHCVIDTGNTTDTTAPLVNLASTNGLYEFCSCLFFGNTLQPSAILPAASSSLVMTGQNNIVGVTAAIDNTAGASLSIAPGSLVLGGSVAPFSAGTTNFSDSTASSAMMVPIKVTRGATGNAVLKGALYADAGERFRLLADGTLEWNSGGSGFSFAMAITPRGDGAVGVNGNLNIQALGNGLRVKEGANAKQGIATLSSGTVVVSNTSVTANSRIVLTAQTLGTVTVPSALCVSARTAATSFTILASQATDTSVVAYQIFEPG